MLSISGLLAIPSEPQKNTVAAGTGFYINFKATSQGKTVDGEPEYHYWDCSIWVPKDALSKWDENIQTGNVLYIEHAVVVSIASKDGRFHNTKIRLDHHTTKRLSVAMWAQE